VIRGTNLASRDARCSLCGEGHDPNGPLGHVLIADTDTLTHRSCWQTKEGPVRSDPNGAFSVLDGEQ
jgi:hypothetical protein